ncbi:MAG: HD-GYP domain-containing protein [Candidatus Omnitrophica bacterium]|nr:HD-GYP domain-containing protein [Candidatus Omnitrophota bacterium]
MALINKKSIKIEILNIIFFSTFFTTAILGSLSFNFSKNRLVSMLGESIKGIAATTASFIKADDIILILYKVEDLKIKRLAATSPAFSRIYEKRADSEISAKDEMLSQAILSYDKYVELLSNIKKMNKIESPINVYVKDGNRLKLVLTSDAVMLIGAEYAIRPEASLALTTDSPQATGLYKDKDGTWISAYAPIPSQRQVVIEINNRIDSYIKRLRRELVVIILACLMLFSGMTLFGYKLVGKLASFIKRLDETATELEKENYEVNINIESEDEIGHLAKTFEKLRDSIKRKIDELRISLIREKKAHLESIIALTNAIELRDPYTRRHLRRVEGYALLIAKKLRLSPEEIEKLRYACYLHDIGKLDIETSILHKVKLSKDEFEEVKKHSEKGAKIVEGIQFLTEIRDIILHHQEHYDGKGYPDGLAGEKIPLLARIVAVADAFDAMTTDRPYKAKISFKEALDNIKKGAGTQFDPNICSIFLEYRDSIEEIADKHFSG